MGGGKKAALSLKSNNVETNPLMLPTCARDLRLKCLRGNRSSKPATSGNQTLPSPRPAVRQNSNGLGRPTFRKSFRPLPAPASKSELRMAVKMISKLKSLA